MPQYSYPWTFDTVHFTFDDNSQHTMDGWHWHGGGGMSAGAWKAMQRKQELQRIKDDDEKVIKRVIRKFLKKED